MFRKLFNFPVFIISLALGLLFIYLSDSQKDTIYVYPTPYNLEKIEYKDVAGNCFNFNSNKKPCPKDTSKIKTIPVQIISEKN